MMINKIAPHIQNAGGGSWNMVQILYMPQAAMHNNNTAIRIPIMVFSSYEYR